MYPELVYVIDVRCYLKFQGDTVSLLRTPFLRDLGTLQILTTKDVRHIKHVLYILLIPPTVAHTIDLETFDPIFQEVAEKFEFLCPDFTSVGIKKIEQDIDFQSFANWYPMISPDKILFLSPTRNHTFYQQPLFNLGDVVCIYQPQQKTNYTSAAVFFDIDDTLLLPSQQNKKITVINRNILEFAYQLQKQYVRVDFIILTSRVPLHRSIKNQKNKLTKLLDELTESEENFKPFQAAFATEHLLKSLLRLLIDPYCYNYENLIRIAYNQVCENLAKFELEAPLDDGFVAEDIADVINNVIRYLEVDLSYKSTHSVINAMRLKGIPLRVDPLVSYKNKTSDKSQVKIDRLIRFKNRQPSAGDYYFFDNDEGELNSALQTIVSVPEQNITLVKCVDSTQVGIARVDQVGLFFKVVQTRKMLLDSITDARPDLITQP